MPPGCHVAHEIRSRATVQDTAHKRGQVENCGHKAFCRYSICRLSEERKRVSASVSRPVLPQVVGREVEPSFVGAARPE